MPSLWYRSESETTRSPALETNRTLAPSAISIGAVSVEETARQRELDGATQQI